VHVDVVSLLQALIRLDTRNPDGAEVEAAMLVRHNLAANGISCELVEAVPGRVSVISRMPGPGSGAGLLVHAHLDTVAPGDGWSRPALAGQLAEGCVWGRGALDMKHAVAMMVAAQVALSRGPGPSRNVVFAYVADEETGGALGARHLVDRRADLFAGIADAIGEVGGFIVSTGSRRVALLQHGEKGVLWARLHATGPGGHGAFTSPRTTPAARVSRIAQRLATPEGSRERAKPAVEAPLWARELIALGSRTTFVPTQIRASSGSPNVVATHASVDLDVRTEDGDHERSKRRLEEAASELALELEILRDEPGFTAPLEGGAYEAVRDVLRASQPATEIVPFILPAATDGRHFARLGIRCYGFVPLPLPAGFDPLSLMHAADERIPVTALTSGAELLAELVVR
jgi:acetylornithine deacetylase/succinyl-diaminopimelate desuccinylase-like protein